MIKFISMKKNIQLLLIILAVGVFGVGFYQFFPTIFGDKLYPLEYTNEINECADRFGLDKPLLAALILKESGFSPRAISRAGAVGLAQLMPATAAGINKREFQYPDYDLFDPKTNICFGAAHLAGLMGTYNGDVTAALIAYNGGDGAARRYLVARDMDVLVTETKLYAPKILAARDVYASMYGNQLPAGKTPEVTPVKFEVPKQPNVKEFWKGFVKDVFARFFSNN